MAARDAAEEKTAVFVAGGASLVVATCVELSSSVALGSTLVKDETLPGDFGGGLNLRAGDLAVGLFSMLLFCPPSSFAGTADDGGSARVLTGVDALGVGGDKLANIEF